MAASNIPPNVDPNRVKPASTPIGLSSLVRAVKRYSLLVFVFVLLAASAGALVYFFLPLPKMTGRVVYLVNTSPGGVLNHNYWNDRDPANYRALQSNTLVRREVLNTALSEPGVSGLPMFQKDPSVDPIQYLQSHLKIDFMTGSEHMRVTLEGDTKEELETVLRAIHTAYLKVVYDQEQIRRKHKLSELQKLQNEQTASIKNIRNQIRGILNVGNTSPEMQDFLARNQHGMLDAANIDLQRLNTQETELALAIAHITGEMKLPPSLRQPVPTELVNNYVEADPQISNLVREIDQMKSNYQQKMGPRKADAPKTPDLLELETRIAAAETKLRATRDSFRGQYAVKLKEEMIKNERNLLDSFEKRLLIVKERRQSLMAESKKIVGELARLKEAAAAADDLRTEMASAENIVSKINSELVTVRTEMTAPTRVAVWEEPYTFPGIEGNRRVKYTALAALGFLVLGLVLAQWLEIRHRRIQTIDEISGGLGLPVIGTVPAMPKGGVGARSNWPHLLTEAVNTTRTLLLSGPNSASTKTFLVTSAMSGEGKTSLTTHLAVSLASAGRRVLLIDADMRRPAVHKVLGVESKPGLAELLTGTSKLDEVTLATKIAGLTLVPAGTYSREAAASLSTERWANILREAAVGFDFVLVDSPPILPVADALAIARNVDGVLISVMQDLSRYGAVQTACQRLSMVGAKVLGVVVSGVKTSGGYYYYYYDERYSSAGAEKESPAAGPVVTVTPPTTP